MALHSLYETRRYYYTHFSLSLHSTPTHQKYTPSPPHINFIRWLLVLVPRFSKIFEYSFLILEFWSKPLMLHYQNRYNEFSRKIYENCDLSFSEKFGWWKMIFRLHHLNFEIPATWGLILHFLADTRVI